ncbi:MAG: ABC transporter ATP-binding protein [Ignavibacteria bacterium]|nr:ABC transporter ATP-binding protein [Ignavibacteria bacterium]
MKSLLALIPYLKKYKLKLILGFICVSLYVAFNSSYPLVIGNAVDELVKNPDINKIIIYALKGITLVFIGGIFIFFTRQTIIVVSREIENDLRNDFFSHLQHLSRNFYNNITTGDLMAHATNDVNNVRNFLGPGIMYSMQTILRTVVTIIILFSINVEVAIIAILPLPFITLLVYFVIKLIYNRSMKVQESFSSLTAKVQEVFSGIRVIKSYTREVNEIEKFDSASADYQKKNLALARLEAFSFPMMFLLTGISIILVIYFGGIKVINGTFTVGNITEFIVYLVQLTWPMIAFGWIMNLIQRAAPSMKRLLNIMETEPDIKDDDKTKSGITGNQIKGKIEFQNMSFKYPGTDVYILKNINLIIESGNSLGIIGYTGAGKSTIVNLIPRVYDISDGAILIDGYDVKTIPLSVLRNLVGIVPQESFLFSDTLEYNISYSSDVTESEKVKRVSEIAGLYKDVSLFPEKFKTIIGERGITLSGGQKQRTSIARALYKNPKILILDDSFSSVDTHTEEEILRELKTVMKNRTCILISHRISTIKECDKIIVLDNSIISEEGTHSELIERKGIYYDIYMKQLLEEEIEEIN